MVMKNVPEDLVLTDVMVPTRGPSVNVGMGTVSTGSSQKGQLGYLLGFLFLHLPLFDFLVVCFFHDLDIATSITSPYSPTLRFSTYENIRNSFPSLLKLEARRTKPHGKR